MSMSADIERMLKTEVPKGKFEYVMKLLKGNYFPGGLEDYPVGRHLTEEKKKELMQRNESVLAAFEVLLVIANGIGFIETYDNAASQEQETFEHGRASTLSEVRRIVEAYEEYIKLLGEELDELVYMATAHGWKSSRYDKGVVCRENIKHLLSELEAKG